MVAGRWWLVKTGTVSDVRNRYAMGMLATSLPWRLRLFVRIVMADEVVNSRPLSLLTRWLRHVSWYRDLQTCVETLLQACLAICTIDGKHMSLDREVLLVVSLTSR